MLWGFHVYLNVNTVDPSGLKPFPSVIGFYFRYGERHRHAMVSASQQIRSSDGECETLCGLQYAQLFFFFIFNMTTWIHLQKNGTKICQLHIPFRKITPYHSNEEQFSLGSPYILEIVKISNGPDFPTGIQTSCDSMATSTMPLACTSSWSLHPGESCTASCSAVDIFPRT